MLERFTSDLTEAKKASDLDFYKTIAMEYRTLELDASGYTHAIAALTEIENEGYGDSVIAWEKHRLLLLLSDGQNQMKQMRESLGFMIGDKQKNRIAGHIERYNPRIHNLILDPQEPDLVTGELIVVRHSEISAVVHGENRILLHAVYDRLTDQVPAALEEPASGSVK